jgi:hypothetical protein
MLADEPREQASIDGPWPVVVQHRSRSTVPLESLGRSPTNRFAIARRIERRPISRLVALRRILPAVDMLIISLNTAQLLRRIFRAKANAQIEIQDHGRQSWIPMDLAVGGS